MRKSQAFSPSTEFSFSIKSGRIALTVLLIIIAVLIYNKAGAQTENYDYKDILKENDSVDSPLNRVFEETEDSIKQSPDTEIQKKRFYNQLEGTENEKVFYRALTIADPLTKELEKQTEPLDQSPGSESARLKSEIKQRATVSDEDLLADVTQELEGTLMEPMIIPIASLDRRTAALMVGIAKIESGYRHNYSYNFWGYAGGYYGFSSPEQAVEVVAKRVKELKNQGLDTPSKIVTTWKCGNSCAGHSKESVQRWIITANGPYSRIAMK